MLRLSVNEIIEKINKEEKLDAIIEDGSFNIKIKEYTYFICTAIHNGNILNCDLEKKINISKYDRWYEEDPLTGDFVSSFPINIIINDSRYEYDLNREEGSCIYDIAWNKKVWKYELNEYEKTCILQKHRNFYLILNVLVNKIKQKYNTCIIYDIHSFNYKRDKIHNEYPIFNIGTERINNKSNRKYILNFKNELDKIYFKNLNNNTMENEVFYGRGYLVKYLLKSFKNILVFPLEIKKIYLDELTGEIYYDILNTIKCGLKNAIITNSKYFINEKKKKDV